jgi:hypothetical protein
LPFAPEGLDEFPAGGELHPVAYAVEKIFVAALVHSNDHNGGAVAVFAGGDISIIPPDVERQPM